MWMPSLSNLVGSGHNQLGKLPRPCHVAALSDVDKVSVGSYPEGLQACSTQKRDTIYI